MNCKQSAFRDLPNPNVFPFSDGLCLRNSVVTFEDYFQPSGRFEDDWRFLDSLQMGCLTTGPSDFPIRPFITMLDTNESQLTAEMVLNGLRVETFDSEHISDLSLTSIPYPGYRPLTRNDEIHTDFHHSYMFRDDADPNVGWHGELLRATTGDSLWYVLIHNTDRDVSAGKLAEFVFMFSVGRSITGPHLIGAVACQMCHNLCD